MNYNEVMLVLGGETEKERQKDRETASQTDRQRPRQNANTVGQV